MKKHLIILFFLVFGTLSAQKKKIYLAPDDHTDYMWTSNEENYKQAFIETLDYYMKLNDSTAHLPYALQHKWNCDGSYWIYIYEKNKSKEEFEKLIGQIKAEKITVPLNGLISNFGMAPLEATLRDMYYAGSLERKYGLKLDLVMSMEDQVLPLGLSSLWAGAGAKYSWRGVCNCVTKVKGLSTRKNEIYWYKGLDDRKILMKWYSILRNPRSLGGYAEAREPIKSLADVKEFMNLPKYPYAISGVFGKGWDDFKTNTNEFVKVAKDNSDKEYDVIISNEVDFFRDFEKKYGKKLPSETISYGSTEWGNSVASLAEVSASVKRSIEKLRAAEALYTIVALKDKKFATDLNDQREKAWIACGLYFEHDWTADGPITRKQRAEWQRKIANQLSSYVDHLYELSLSRLGDLISKSDKTKESFFVFNPLSWTRTDFSDCPYTGSQAIVVVDKTTAKEVPFQLISKKDKKYLRVWASDIPSLGYKVFEIKEIPNAPKVELAASINDGVIENTFYKIKFTAQGVITSLIDKSNNNRECINPINKLYANDLGSGDNIAPLNDSALRVENAGSVSVTLVAESYKPVKHSSKITLFKNSDRIELENYITQNLNEKPTTYAFSFNITNPEIWHEEAGAILNVKPISKGGHYADSICRLDWIAMNHFADISGNGQGVFLSNRDAYFIKPGTSSVSTLDYITPQMNVLAAGQIDKDNGLGIENQDGDSYFENFFALKPHTGGFESSSAMKFALEHQNALIAGQITGQNGVCIDQYSLLKVSNPKVLVWSMKPAEEGIDNGIIVRVWNLDNKDAKCTFTFKKKIISARKTSHIETNGAEIKPIAGKLNLILGHNKIETFRIFLEK